MRKNRIWFVICMAVLFPACFSAQILKHVYSTENNLWQQDTIELQPNPEQLHLFEVEATENVTAFRNWGVIFNEFGCDVLTMLARTKQNKILYNVFSPQGKLCVSRALIDVGANDYSRFWYSCDGYISICFTALSRLIESKVYI